MVIHLKLELTNPQEIEDWKKVKAFLNIKANTDALRSLIRQKALEIQKGAA